jgi:hypothetical protein
VMIEINRSSKNDFLTLVEPYELKYSSRRARRERVYVVFSIWRIGHCLEKFSGWRFSRDRYQPFLTFRYCVHVHLLDSLLECYCVWVPDPNSFKMPKQSPVRWSTSFTFAPISQLTTRLSIDYNATTNCGSFCENGTHGTC